MPELMRMDLRWFDDPTPPDLPDATGVGGVLSVWVESGSMNCSYLEVKEALDHGWIVAVFQADITNYDDGKLVGFVTACGAVTDSTGDTPVTTYTILAGSDTYTASAADAPPAYQAPAADNSGSGGSSEPA